MVRVTSIELTRGEGRHDEIFTVVIKRRPSPATVWDRANRALYQWAETIGNWSDAVDFVVTYEDGETYSGTYLLRSREAETPDLADHMLTHLNMAADRQWPKYYDAKRIAILKSYDSWKEGVPAANAFLDKYEVGNLLLV